MKPRHAAALALVGWYLMVPPPHTVLQGVGEGAPLIARPAGEEGPSIVQEEVEVPNPKAPLSQWSKEASFDTAKECEAKRKANRRAYAGFYRGLRDYALTAAVSAQCVATDDPRLKEK